MRKLLIVAAALTVGAFSLGSAKADPSYYPGGEVQRAGMCQVTTDPFGFYGYVTACPTAPKPVHRHKMRASH
jgi:hypothetical protein